jgi:uncharacterized membrane protein
MHFLLLSITCSLTTATVLKIAGVRALHTPVLLTANYLTATGVAALVLVPAGEWKLLDASPGLFLFGALSGLIFIGGFFSFALATRFAGMSLAVGIMRVSVVLPVLVSWMVWQERPSVGQGVGLALAGVAFLGLAHRNSRTEGPRPQKQALAALTLVLVLGGLSDVSLKMYSEVYAEAVSAGLFMTMVFGMAGLMGVLWTIASPVGPSHTRLGSWRWGMLLGLANLGSVAFLLPAIEQLPGPVVFPLNNAGIMLGATLIGRAIWQEKMTRPNRLGLGLAVVAIALLSL